MGWGGDSLILLLAEACEKFMSQIIRCVTAWFQDRAIYQRQYYSWLNIGVRFESVLRHIIVQVDT